MKRIFLTASFFVSLTSCVTPHYIKPHYINREGLMAMHKNMTSEQVEKIFPKRQKKDFNVASNTKVTRYQLLKGMETRSSVICTPNGCFPYTYNVPITKNYYLVYQNNRLVHWGDLVSLNRNTNSEFRKIGKLINAQEIKQRVKKKEEAAKAQESLLEYDGL